MNWHQMWEKNDRGWEVWDFYAPGATTPCRRFEIRPLKDSSGEFLLVMTVIHFAGNTTIIKSMIVADVYEAKRAVKEYDEEYG